MAKKMSRTKLVEELCFNLFNLYIMEHGGMEKQPYLTMCWMHGRLDDVLKAIKDKVNYMEGKQNGTKQHDGPERNDQRGGEGSSKSGGK
jgi:hypothetical protein